MKIILIVQHDEDEDHDIEKLQQKQLQEMLARMAMPEVSYDHSSSLLWQFLVRRILLEMYYLISLNRSNFRLLIMILIISHVIKGFKK